MNEAEATLAEELRTLLSDGPVWVQVGQLLDGKAAVQRDMHLVFDAETTLHIGNDDEPPAADLLKAGQIAPDLHLEQYTVMPGLTDGHTHIFLEGAELNFEKRKAYQQQTPEALLNAAQSRCSELVKHGIVAVRDGGDKDGVGLALSSTRPEQLGTDVFSPGPGINRVKRYGSFFCEPYENFDSAEAVVDDRISRGADHIKVVPTGIINFAKAAVVAKPQYTVDELRAVTDAAHARGKQVMAHASGETGIQIAIEGGVDTIEHGYFISDEQLALMAELGTVWVPTFAPVQVQIDEAEAMGWNELERDNLKQIIDNHMKSLQKALALGVRVLVGSDAGSCGVGHASGLFYEMELMERAGMPTTSLINAATGGNAQALIPDSSYGSLEQGKKPRMIFMKADPTITVSNLREPKTVICGGQIHDSSLATMRGF